MKVIVLGAGVIGVTTAYFLAKNGHEVTVLEKNHSCAMGCSYANGGQLSYSHFEPWSAKASFPTFLAALLKSPSFLSVSDFFNKEFLSWSCEFFKNSDPEISKKNSKKIFAINDYSRKVLAEVIADETTLDFDYSANGILHFFRDPKAYAKALEEADLMRELGCAFEILTAEECVKREPTLSKLDDDKKLIGGIFYPSDASGNSAAFTRGLERICREKYKVTFEYGAEIRNIFTNYQRITGINTSNGVFVADKYVYCLGALGNRLLKGIGIDPKIYPLKGYSFSIPASAEFIAPKIALTDQENKIVYSRIGNIFRAAGTVEACGLKLEPNKKHYDFLRLVIRSSFSDFGNINEVSDWCGFRPFRPNSIPLICQIKKYGNLILNTGHGSLGWTMAAASGKISADLILNKRLEQFEFLSEEEQSVYINK